MTHLYWGLITLAVVVAAGFFVSLIIELRQATKALKEFLNTTENSLKPTLEEFQKTLKSTRNIADNVTAVTEDMKRLSGSVRQFGDNVQEVSERVKGISVLIEELGSTVTANVSGLKVGVRAAAEVFLRNLFKRG